MVWRMFTDERDCNAIGFWIFDQKLIGNQYRSAFIEAMVEPYLEARGWRYAGDGWSGWDFEHREGSRLEIKQSAAANLVRCRPACHLRRIRYHSPNRLLL